jgi:uncharacterized protein (TIGR04222 family)
MNPFEMHGTAYLGFYTGALMFGAVTAIVARHMILNVDRNPWVPSDAIARELDPYEAAFLVGGSERAFVSACATLARHKYVVINRSDRTMSLYGPGDLPRLHELETGIVKRLKAAGGTGSLVSVKQSVSGIIATIRGRLADKGLATDDDTKSRAIFIPWFWFIAVTLIFSWPKIAMAQADKHPHGFLIMLAVLAFMLSLAFFRNADRTNKGRAAVEFLTRNHSALHLTASTNPAGLSLRDTALAYGVFGAVSLVGDPFADALYGTRPQQAQGAGGGGGGGHGCGSSCGGGGCGGGGCGGCGG